MKNLLLILLGFTSLSSFALSVQLITPIDCEKNHESQIVVAQISHSEYLGNMGTKYVGSLDSKKCVVNWQNEQCDFTTRVYSTGVCFTGYSKINHRQNVSDNLEVLNPKVYLNQPVIDTQTVSVKTTGKTEFIVYSVTHTEHQTIMFVDAISLPVVVTLDGENVNYRYIRSGETLNLRYELIIDSKKDGYKLMNSQQDYSIVLFKK